MKRKNSKKIVLHIIVPSDDAIDDADYQNLINFFDTHQYENSKAELAHYFLLILVISANHHRYPNFFEKIEKILTDTSKFCKPFFSNEELFTIFQESKLILVSLLKTKIIS